MSISLCNFPIFLFIFAIPPIPFPPVLPDFPPDLNISINLFCPLDG